MVLTKNEEGYTLIIVLWSIVILTIIFSYLLDDVILDSHLIEGYSQQKQLREVALSAYNIGINSLLNDQTVYDSSQDDWLNPIEGSMEGVSYLVKISDIGSRLNINYEDLAILREIKGWDEQIEAHIEKSLIAELYLINNLISDDSSNDILINDSLTTYGKFNLNQDSPEKLHKLFNLLDLNYVSSEMIIESLKEYRDDGEMVTNLEELPTQIDGLDFSAFQKIKPFLTVQGRININLVSVDNLNAIFKGKEIDQAISNQILSYRKENEISEINELENLLGEDRFEEIAGLFTTQSKYIKLNISAVMAEKRRYEIDCIITREYQDGNWQIEVISWSENDVFLE